MKGKCIVFHGGDHRVGCSMLLQCIAERLISPDWGLKVLVTNLQPKPGSEYINFVGESMDDIRPYLDQQLLNRRELLEGSKVKDGFHIISGIGKIEEERYYQPDMAEYLLTELQEDFDVLLVDSGSNIDNGLTVGALASADIRCLCLTQRENVLRQWERVKPLYDKLNLNFTHLMINRYDGQNIYSADYIADRLKLQKVIVHTVAESGYGIQAETESKSLLNYRSEKLKEDIGLLCNCLMAESGFTPKEEKKRKPWKSFISENI